MMHLEKAVSDVYRKELDPIFLYKNGARMPSILGMLEDFQQNNGKGKTPVLVAIVGLVGDALSKKTVPAGHSTFEMRLEVKNKRQEFPALGGMLKMRGEVEGKLDTMWPGIRTLWVLPYPADLCTFVRSYAAEPVTREIECGTNKISLEFNNYMAALDKVFQREELDRDVLPWIQYWKDASGQEQGTPCEFRTFMAKVRNGERVPVLYPNSTLDGLYPRTRTSQGLIRAIARKVRYTLTHPKKESFPPVPSSSAPVPSSPAPVPSSSAPVPSSSDPTPSEVGLKALVEKVDQACQIDEGIERDTPVTRKIILPCLHTMAVVTTVEEGFLCEECDTFFLRDNVYLASFWSIYRFKP